MTTHTFKPDLPPPAMSVGVLAWLRANLFSSWFNTLLTLVGIYLVYLILPPLLEWAIIKADWTGSTRADCSREGACWVFIGSRFGQFMYGFYPEELRWRVDLTVLFVVFGAAPLFLKRFAYKVKYGLCFLVALPIVAYWLLHGGFLGLETVPTSAWGGLMLTVVIAAVGICGAMPLGILLALGRRSKMPAIKVICVTTIEFWRGVPLITVLFMSSVMLPLFLPEGFSIDKLLRAQIAIIMFAAAYIAETVRGGLQAIPKGQYEGADSLGLNYWQQMRKIILPQALKIVIPPLVSIFIALFKDTSLVVIIGIFDLTLAAKAALSDAAWRGFGVEAYLFISLIYFVFCFSMSKYSQALEKRLATGHAR